MISSIHIVTARDQQENKKIEKVDDKSQCQNNEYYMPHKTVVI